MTFLYREYLAYANFLEAWAQTDELSERQAAAAENRYAAYSARAKAAEVAYAYHTKHRCFWQAVVLFAPAQAELLNSKVSVVCSAHLSLALACISKRRSRAYI